MAKNNTQRDELFDLLRERGVRKRLAVEDLDAAAAEIRTRLLPTGRTRARNTTKRQASAKTGAQTRRTAARTRTRAR
jgi:hypothetical protein